MILRELANAAINTINPDVTVGIKMSNGYTIGAGAKQIPAYLPEIAALVQIQAMSDSELGQIDGLNLQTVMRGMYVKGVLSGVIRAASVGGDLVFWNGQTWLVTKVLEQWPNWVKVVIVLQDD